MEPKDPQLVANHLGAKAVNLELLDMLSIIQYILIGYLDYLSFLPPVQLLKYDDHVLFCHTGQSEFSSFSECLGKILNFTLRYLNVSSNLSLLLGLLRLTKTHSEFPISR